MIFLFPVFFLFSFWPFGFAEESKKKPVLLMAKGENLYIPSPSFERIWLSQSGVVSVQDRGESLGIQARKEGEVLLNVGSRVYLIQVLSESNKKHIEDLKKLFSHRMGLEVQFAQGHLRVRGRLYRVKDFIALVRTAREQKISYLFEADVDPSLRPALKIYIMSQIKNPLFPAPVLLWQKPLTALLPEDSSVMDFYQVKLRPFGIRLKKDPSLLPSHPLVKLKILLVESTAQSSLQTHIDYGDKVINRLLDGRLFKELVLGFKALENKGQARILSEAVILSESGKKAHFHSGGSVPVPHFNPESGAQSVRWKPYGIQLDFLAKVDRNNRIHVQTQVEISEVDHSYSAHATPALKASRITSAVTMQSGQSLLLSRLIRRQSGKSHSAPPTIFRLPLAGSLFSFKGKIEDRTRLHIFITAGFSSQNKGVKK